MEGEQEKQGWYSDREMFEMIQGLTIELTETRTTIKKYNGLWENRVDRRLTAIEQRSKWRASIFRAIRDWGGWLVGVGGLVIAGITLYRTVRLVT